MSKNRQRRQKSNLIDKIADQSIPIVLSFLLVTALIGGSGYILFQYPAEKNTLDRQVQEHENSAIVIRQSNDMFNVFTSGWFANQTNWQQEKAWTNELLNNIKSQTLDPTLEQEVLNWVSSTLLRLTLERGRIAGFVFNDEIERALQQDILKQYDILINRTRHMDKMVRNWEQELRARNEFLASMQDTKLESMANFQGILSRAGQLQDQDKIKRQDNKQKRREFESQRQIIRLKTCLAGIGIIIGVSLAVLVGQAVIRKNARK